VQISSQDITTAGDTPNVLIAMNPAGLKANVGLLERGATIIVNVDAFDERSLTKAGYAENPLSDGSLGLFTVFEVPMTSITTEVCKEAGVKPRDAERSKNFFALGLVSWLYSRPTESTVAWIEQRFAKNDLVREANLRAFRAGYDFGETAELFESRYRSSRRAVRAGRVRQHHRQYGVGLGFDCRFPTGGPAAVSRFLPDHARVGHPARTLQAQELRRANLPSRGRDRRRGVGVGAAYGGALAVTTTSGPGLDLKSETIGLAISLELPLIIVDVQRGGPSTGLPTKVEQADLLHAMYGRHGEAPLPVIAALTPGDCFDAALEAARIAVTYRTPVILLSDAYLANGTEPWLLPEVDSLPALAPNFATTTNATSAGGEAAFWPYLRDPETLARPWAPPGVAGLEHRVGGLEKADGHGNVSYDGLNHERMTHLRADKVAGIVASIPDVEVDDPTDDAEILVLGWGGTHGAIVAGVARARARGRRVARAQLRHLNPFPANLGEVLRRYEKVLVPELNLGQLSTLLRAKYLVDAQTLSKVQGVPLRASEIDVAIENLIGEQA
jgi:2-oxoglutarate ferredoxin oxidoreductase subunit alpha